jgi:hypothetical protein
MRDDKITCAQKCPVGQYPEVLTISMSQIYLCCIIPSSPTHERRHLLASCRCWRKEKTSVRITVLSRRVLLGVDLDGMPAIIM